MRKIQVKPARGSFPFLFMVLISSQDAWVEAKCFPWEVAQVLASTSTQTLPVISTSTSANRLCDIKVNIVGQTINSSTDVPEFCKAVPGDSISARLESFCCDELPCEGHATEVLLREVPIRLDGRKSRGMFRSGRPVGVLPAWAHPAQSQGPWVYLVDDSRGYFLTVHANSDLVWKGIVPFEGMHPNIHGFGIPAAQRKSSKLTIAGGPYRSTWEVDWSKGRYIIIHLGTDKAQLRQQSELPKFQ